MNQTLLTNSLLSTINELFSSLFSSIDGKTYELLDDLLFINSTDFVTSEVKTLLGDSQNPRNDYNL